MLPCPLCLSAGAVLETDIDEAAEVTDPGGGGGVPPASVTCPLCDGLGDVPAGVGFEDAELETLDDGGAAGIDEDLREWIEEAESGNLR